MLALLAPRWLAKFAEEQDANSSGYISLSEPWLDFKPSVSDTQANSSKSQLLFAKSNLLFDCNVLCRIFEYDRFILALLVTRDMSLLISLGKLQLVLLKLGSDRPSSWL